MGESARRTLPTIWVQRWRVAQLSFQPAKGRAGQLSGCVLEGICGIDKQGKCAPGNSAGPVSLELPIQSVDRSACGRSEHEGRVVKNGRLTLDLSNIARWLGRPTGIVRREQALVRYALARRPDISFCVLDESRQAFRTVRREWVEPLSQGTMALDFDSATYRRQRRGWRKRLPSRFLLLHALERRRLASQSQAERRVLGAAERLLYWPRDLPPRFKNRDGTSHRALAFDLVLAGPEPLDAHDTILSVGNYTVCDAAIIAALKHRHRFRYVSMCQDLIALDFPQFFSDGVADRVRRHWTAVLPLAERILVNSRTVERDVRAYCRALGREPGEIVLVHPGCDLSDVAAAPNLPAGLT